MTNTIREKIAAGGFLTGTHVFCGAPMLTEEISMSGFDAVWIDMEHTAIGKAEVLQNLIAVRAGGAYSFVRIPWNDAVQAKPIIDMGTDAIIFPYVRSAEEAEYAAASCAYPPDGIRGYGPLRAGDYGGISQTEYVDRRFRDMLRIIQIEHIDAVNDLERIAAVKGIDGFIVGPNDLSGSVGHIGRPNHPDMMPVSPAFYGTFDGDYHVIRGMYCHADDKAGAENNGWNSTVGLFGALNGSVKRLGFENCVVDRSKTVGNGAGILCALLGNNTSSMNPKVSEVYVKDSISASFRSPGVIAGTVQKGVISDCYTVGSKAVLYRTDGEGDAGTIVGYISASAGVGSVKDCYTLSQLVIPAENKSSVSGPVVGNVNSMGDVQNVYYDPQISRVDAETVTRAYIHNDAKDYVELIELSKDKMTVSAMKLNKNLWKDADGELSRAILSCFTARAIL